MTPLDEVRSRIDGEEPLLLVNAPAGHGKTHEAARAANHLAAALPRPQRVLLLSHTHAARHAFRQAIGPQSRVVHRTLDAFAHDVVETYGPYLGVPAPLYPGDDGHPSFKEMRAQAIRLLTLASPIARGIALGFPIILVDEHQDSSQPQHELVMTIARAGPVRLRLFGDAMQGIFDFDEPTVEWDALRSVEPSVELDHGYRWDHAPALRDWLVRARMSLMRGEPVDLRNPPTSVSVLRWNGSAPEGGQRGYAPDCFKALWKLNNRNQVAVLVRHNLHAQQIRTRVHFLTLHEGADPAAPRKLLDAVIRAEGDPVGLVAALLDALSYCGTGLDAGRIRQVKEACTLDGINLGRKQRIKSLVGIVEPLYETPTAAAWLECLRQAWTQAQDLSWMPYRRETLGILASLRVDDGDPRRALYGSARGRKEAMRVPGRVVTTVHKAKGLEFAEVALPYLAAPSFPDTNDARRLLYVALTRATRQLHLMVPSDNPSPLVAI